MSKKSRSNQSKEEQLMAKQGDKDKDKAPVGVAPVKKDGKSR